MKFLILPLLLIHCVSASKNDFNFTRINHVAPDEVRFLDFDSDSNIYLFTKHEFYKLNSKKEIVINFGDPPNVQKMIVTPENYLYAFSLFENILTINELSPNATGFKPIYRYRAPEKMVFITDKIGNIIFNTKYGVAVLRKGDSLPRGIANLENFHITNDHSYFVDASGIYLGGVVKDDLTKHTTNSIAAITKISSTQPEARIIHLQEKNVKITSLTKLGSDLIVGFSGNNAKISKLYPFTNYLDQKSYLNQYEYNFLESHVRNDTYYVLGLNLLTNKCNLNVGGRYGAKQLDLEFYPRDCKGSQILTDKTGQVFIATANKLYWLKRTEEGGYDLLDILEDNDVILSVNMFEGKELWILKRKSVSRIVLEPKPIGGIHQLEDKSLANDRGILKINKNSNEVFVGSDMGLFYSHVELGHPIEDWIGNWNQLLVVVEKN